MKFLVQYMYKEVKQTKTDLQKYFRPSLLKPTLNQL